jgi:outer membrane lipoprotein-sorting protein
MRFLSSKFNFNNLIAVSAIAFLMPICCFAKVNGIMVSPPEEKFFGDVKLPSLHKKYAKEIKEIEGYLNSFHSMSGQFKQSNKEGSIGYGKLFISKPGKIRCEYLKPSPVLLIVNENKITYYDQELDEVSYTSANVNALKMLALKNIQFQDLNLVEVEKEKHFFNLMVKEYSQELKQNLVISLSFSYPKVSLKQVTITTEENEIDMIFDNVVYNLNLGKELFVFYRNRARSTD